MKKPIDFLKTYNELVVKAKELKYVQTDNFLGDIVETIVCNRLGLKKVKASTKGYDALNGKLKVQIKYRSLSKKGVMKITFKNLNNQILGFDQIVVVTMIENKLLFFHVENEVITKKVIHRDDKAVLKTHPTELKDISLNSWSLDLQND